MYNTITKSEAVFPCGFLLSLRGKRFCGVREQRITARKLERVKGGGGEERKETQASVLPLASFSAQVKHQKSGASSFFAPKPHGNACYAGYFLFGK